MEKVSSRAITPLDQMCQQNLRCSGIFGFLTLCQPATIVTPSSPQMEGNDAKRKTRAKVAEAPSVGHLLNELFEATGEATLIQVRAGAGFHGGGTSAWGRRRGFRCRHAGGRGGQADMQCGARGPRGGRMIWLECGMGEEAYPGRTDVGGGQGGGIKLIHTGFPLCSPRSFWSTPSRSRPLPSLIGQSRA